MDNYRTPHSEQLHVVERFHMIDGGMTIDMVHLWQAHFGKPSPHRAWYHNREWAAKMKEIGLQSTDTGEPGGTETGDRVFQLIVEDGLFDKTIRCRFPPGSVVTWTELPEGAENKRSTKSGKRPRYNCPVPGCKRHAWSTHDADRLRRS